MTQKSIRTAIQKVNNTVMVYAYKNADQTGLTASSWNKLSLDKVVYDAGQNYDTTQHKFIAPVTGLYKIRGSVSFTSVIATKAYQVALYKNGSALKYEAGHSSTADDVSVPIEIEVFLQADDYIELYANPLAGANTVAAKSGSAYTTLTIRLITKEGIRQ